MKLKIKGDLMYDCTRMYDVTLNDYSVRYFINEVLKRKKEYGTIAINGDKFEYRYGRLLDYPKQYINDGIVDITGMGGYFLMNYEIKTKYYERVKN